MKTVQLPVLLAAVLVGWLSLAPAATAQDNVAYSGVDACNRAIDLLDEGKPKEALEVLTKAEDTIDAADLWVWWGNKGLCHRELREDEEALKCFTQALELKEDCWFRMRRASLLHQFGRWDEALKDIEAEVEHNGESDRTTGLRAVIHGPWKGRWPTIYPKLEMTSRLGNYRVVSDFGYTAEELDDLEARAAELDPEHRRYDASLKALLEPNDQLELMCDLMEHTRQNFMKFVGMKERDWPTGKVVKVFFFRDEEGFHTFETMTGGSSSEHTAGFYDESLRYLQLYSGQGGRKVYGIDEESIDTLIHEAWHQFFHVLTDHRPIWMDEGLAEFLAKFKTHRGGRELEFGVLVRTRPGLVTRYEHIREVVNEGNHIPFKEFFRLNSESWYEYDTGICYAQVWGVAYWALKGKRNAKFRKAYTKYFWGCVNGENREELFEEHFPDEELERYEAEWIEYIKRL